MGGKFVTYVIFAVGYAVFAYNFGDTAHRSFAYNFGQGLVWPIVIWRNYGGWVGLGISAVFLFLAAAFSSAQEEAA